MSFYAERCEWDEYDNWPVPFCNDKHCLAASHVSNEVLGSGVGKTAYCGRHCTPCKWNQKCVIKFYNDSYVFDQDFWSREIKAHKIANDLAMAWNKRQFCNQKIRVLVPQQQILKKANGHSRKRNEYCLVEDYLDNFEKFNSNTMTCKGFEHMSIQAFSHWTYHYTKGQYLFVDCQGSFDKRSGYTLTDPVIVSKMASFWSSSSMGPCDGGRQMMLTWFENHECNQYCQRHWKRAIGKGNGEKRQKSLPRLCKIKATERTSYIWNISNDFKKRRNAYLSLMDRYSI